MPHRALFLDRDGTLVRARHFPSRPEELEIFAGVAPLLAQFHRAGFRIVIVTNQSGLALGYFDAAALEAMHAHLRQELARQGATITAIYYCPHDPAGRVPGLAIPCDCRKPRPGMLLRAAAEHELDLARSWLVGDILHDIEAGRRAGCRTALVNNGGETEWIAGPYRAPQIVAPDTVAALRSIAAIEGIGSQVLEEATHARAV